LDPFAFEVFEGSICLAEADINITHGKKHAKNKDISHPAGFFKASVVKYRVLGYKPL
jgi:hypothetical protein